MIEQQQAQRVSAGETAGFGERLVAYLVDLVILVAAQLALRIAGAQGPTLTLISVVIGLVYTIGFWSAGGATPGKMLMHLQVVGTDGGEIGIGSAVVRYLGYIVSGVALGLGFLWIIWDEKHEGWHDKIAKTRVIRVR